MQQLLICLFLFILLPVNQDSDGLSLYPYWKKGDTQTISIQEGFVKYENNVIVKKDVTHSTVDISVLEETDSTYVMEWKYRDYREEKINIETEEEDEEDAYIDKRLEEMFDEVTLRYETNEFGEIKRMLNLEEIMSAMSDSMDLLIENEMELKGEDAAIFMEFMREMFDSELLQDEMTRDIYNYHFYLGNTFPQDTSIQYLDTIPNKLGGPDIPQTGLVTVQIDTTSETIQINDLKKSNEDSAKASIVQVIDSLNTSKAEEVKSGMQTTSLSITDIENYTYDYYLGWLKHYKRNRINQLGDNRTERFIIIDEVKGPEFKLQMQLLLVN